MRILSRFQREYSVGFLNMWSLNSPNPKIYKDLTTWKKNKINNFAAPITVAMTFITISYIYNNFNRPLEEIKIVVMRILLNEPIIPLNFVMTKTRFRNKTWLLPVIYFIILSC